MRPPSWISAGPRPPALAPRRGSPSHRQHLLRAGKARVATAKLTGQAYLAFGCGNGPMTPTDPYDSLPWDLFRIQPTGTPCCRQRDRLSPRLEFAADKMPRLRPAATRLMSSAFANRALTRHSALRYDGVRD